MLGFVKTTLVVFVFKVFKVFTGGALLKEIIQMHIYVFEVF